MKQKMEVGRVSEPRSRGAGWGRRRFLFTAAALLLPFGNARQSSADTDPRLIRRFTVEGMGGYGGETWNDAMPLEWLGRSLAQAEPGSTFLIGFGPDQVMSFGASRVPLLTSGSLDQPIVIQAGSIPPGDEAAAGLQTAKRTLFRSSRQWSIDKVAKGPLFFFGIAKGASNIRISGFRMDGTSPDGFFKFGAKKNDEQTFSNISFSDIHAANVGRVIETSEGASLDHLSIVDCSAKGIVRGFARFRTVSNAVFRNLDLDADNFDGGGKNVCEIISIEAGENIEFENVTLKNALNEKNAGVRDKGAGYIQGDGIVCEWKTKNVTIRKCHAEGMGDAAFDLKTTDAIMEDCSTAECKFGARFWSHSNNVVRRSAFRSPRTRGKTNGACVQAVGSVDVHDCEFEVVSGCSAFNLTRRKAPPIIKVFGGSVQIKEGGRLASGSPGSVLELHDVSVNGTLRNQTYVLSDQVGNIE